MTIGALSLDELMAREAIRDLVARYNAGGDGGRFDDVVPLFAEDAVMEIPGETMEGREAIAAMFRRTQQRVLASGADGPRPHVRHFTATLQIDLEDEDHARSRCYYQVLMAHGLDHWGRYIDHYARLEGRWLFAHRKVTVDGRREGGSPMAG
jgi:uncharacterized protein (TIGR02246 family)